MTTFEHFMLCTCFGGMLGWVFSDLVFLLYDFIRSAKRKKKLRLEQKQLESTEQADKE